jgi:hypothetical protein
VVDSKVPSFILVLAFIRSAEGGIPGFLQKEAYVQESAGDIRRSAITKSEAMGTVKRAQMMEHDICII